MLDGEKLLRFIRGGYGALAADLVERGANPNATDTYGPALTQAIRARYETLAGWLIEKGADPNATDTYGPALTQAIRAGYKALAAKLIESGAKSNAKDASVSTLRTSQDRSLVDLAETLFPAQFVTYGGSSSVISICLGTQRGRSEIIVSDRGFIARSVTADEGSSVL